MISLTQQERDKFALWLEQSAQSNAAMAEQMKMLDGIDAVSKRLKQRAAIYSIVAQELREIESTVIE